MLGVSHGGLMESIRGDETMARLCSRLRLHAGGGTQAAHCWLQPGERDAVDLDDQMGNFQMNSIFHPPSSILHPPSSIIHPPSSSPAGRVSSAPTSSPSWCGYGPSITELIGWGGHLPDSLYVLGPANHLIAGEDRNAEILGCGNDDAIV